jgi:pimeloyl-ACP methyl ester carboxylesterase
LKRTLFILLIAAFVLAAIGWFWVQKQGAGLHPSELESRYMTANDQVINVSGAKVRVRQQGPEDAPKLVLLHGFTYSLECWDAFAAELDDEYRIIRYDLLGHGLTGPDPEQRYSPTLRAEFLQDVLDALGVQTASIAGNSLGGTVAWRFAAAHPERVEKLILIDGPAFAFNAVTDTPMEPPAAVAMFLRYAPMAGLKQAANYTWADPARLSEPRLQQIQDMMQRQGNAPAFLAHIAQFTMPDPTDELSRIIAPTLILWGEKDLLIPVSQAKRMQAAIADADLQTIPDAGHMPQEEQPRATAKLARDFLSTAPAR